MITKVHMAAPGAAAISTETQTLSVKVISVSLAQNEENDAFSLLEADLARHTGERRKTCCRKVSESRKELIFGETLREQTEGEIR